MIALPQNTPGFVVEQVTGRLVAVVGRAGERGYVVWDGRARENGDPLLRTIWARKTFPLVDVMPTWWFAPHREPVFFVQPHAPQEPILCWETKMGPLWAWQGELEESAAPMLHLVSRTTLQPLGRTPPIERKDAG